VVQALSGAQPGGVGFSPMTIAGNFIRSLGGDVNLVFDG
jgi:hypothetical protein